MCIHLHFESFFLHNGDAMVVHGDGYYIDIRVLSYEILTALYKPGGQYNNQICSLNPMAASQT